MAYGGRKVSDSNEYKCIPTDAAAKHAAPQSACAPARTQRGAVGRQRNRSPSLQSMAAELWHRRCTIRVGGRAVARAGRMRCAALRVVVVVVLGGAAGYR